MSIQTICGPSGKLEGFEAVLENGGVEFSARFANIEAAEEFLIRTRPTMGLSKSRRRAQALRAALSDPASAPLTTASVSSILRWYVGDYVRGPCPLLPAVERKLESNVRVFELTDDWTEAFCKLMLQTPSRPGGPPLARGTVANYLGFIGRACRVRAMCLGIDPPSLGLSYRHLPRRLREPRERRLRGNEADRIRAALGRIGVGRKTDESGAQPGAGTSARHYQLVFEFAIETCARQRELLGMAWSEIDLGQRVWRLPIGRSATGRARSVHLTQNAIEILEGLAADRDAENGLVFHRLPKPPSFVRRWKAVMEGVGARDLRFADLRFEGAMRLVCNPRVGLDLFAGIFGEGFRTASEFAHWRSPAVLGRLMALDEADRLRAHVSPPPGRNADPLPEATGFGEAPPKRSLRL